ncbi:flagellar biosynthesis protein FlhF [Orenia metallireducens]|jgi:flagellar biosynthesis protein FlhF|uniref:Flagellar biosynthesis protein FlhF n=1 Tax=Orenia metallireducens TaxID=1413210 RepID=A0A1C0AA19_9FIRM|nr:flagellar biosynthesis protein FlhF [Orenia metallireducens]OCL27103.1 flagellar biosynthesis protein FlhF [Orenia metallireducens]
MKIKKYRAETMQEAILKVKSDLGSDAIILHTRKFKQGGFFGLFAKKMVEVIATADQDNKKRKESKLSDSKQIDENIILKSELSQMKNMMNDLMGEIKNKNQQSLHLVVNPALERLIEALWTLGLSRKMAKDLAEEIANKVNLTDLNNEEIKDILREELKKELIDIQPIELEAGKTKVVSLVGPTGVGKTTTLAKLAARFSLFENKKVGLITADTYRIAAVDQLKTYSEIINLPLEVVFTPQELLNAIKGYSGYDLVLIDTAGRSQNNQLHISELKGFINNVPIDEIYLVLSATTKVNDLMKIIEVYNEIDLDKLIITKLDETNSWGTILEATAKAKKPLSYITVGQDVPEDIKLPESEQLVEDILKGLEL